MINVLIISGVNCGLIYKVGKLVIVLHIKFCVDCHGLKLQCSKDFPFNFSSFKI